MGQSGAFVHDASTTTSFPQASAKGMLNLLVRESSPFDQPRYRAMQDTVLASERVIEPPIWLVTEKLASGAQDNGFAFFKHCYTQHFDRPVFYVIREDSPDRVRLEPFKDRVVLFYSAEHFRLLRQARLLIGSDSKTQFLLPGAVPGPFTQLLADKPMVFLQHGVLALKDVTQIYKHGGSNAADKFIVSTKGEQQIVVDRLGYPPSDVWLTGLARWDSLVDTSTGSGHILVVPTWRSWLHNDDQASFRESAFFHHYDALLSSPELDAVLKRRDMTLSFYVHPLLSQFLPAFTKRSDRVHIVQPAEQPMNELLMSCDALITDYSSVAWDVLYLNKPVLFDQFDRATYLQKQGAYIDFANDLPGPTASTPAGVVQWLQRTAEQGFELDERFSRMQSFEHRSGHCERIYTLVVEYDSASASSWQRGRSKARKLWGRFKNALKRD